MNAITTLAQIKDRLAAATPGPWEEFYGDVVQSFELAVQTGEHEHERVGIVPGEYVRYDDATFIAAAPTDIARLIGAVEAVLEQAEARAITLRTTADRLNQQVMDRDPDRDIDAAVRYSHYATGAEASLSHLRTAIEKALNP